MHCTACTLRVYGTLWFTVSEELGQRLVAQQASLKYRNAAFIMCVNMLG